MWSPLGDEGMEAYYPGDDYVDLVGITVFGLQTWDRAKYGDDRSFEDVFAPRYERAASFGKPVVVAELGYVGAAALCREMGGRCAQSLARNIPIWLAWSISTKPRFIHGPRALACRTGGSRTRWSIDLIG